MARQPAKIIAKFYVDPELWATAQIAIEGEGLTYSEAISRLLALLVATPEDQRAKLFRFSPTKALQIHADRAKP